MQPSSSSDHDRPQPFLRRVDRMLGEINALLVALAIGLAALDLTCFVMMSTLSALHAQPQWMQTIAQPVGNVAPPGEIAR